MIRLYAVQFRSTLHLLAESSDDAYRQALVIAASGRGSAHMLEYRVIDLDALGLSSVPTTGTYSPCVPLDDDDGTSRH